MNHPSDLDMALIQQAARAIKAAERAIAFTGAGISVESGVPPFRGPEGLWSKYDPKLLEIDYALAHPKRSWEVIKEIFYDYFGEAEPNAAHKALSRMETEGDLAGVITQNIDYLHQQAGSETVIEFHGNSHYLICLECDERYEARPELLATLPPRCEVCGGLLKPDFVFFGEPIPLSAQMRAFAETQRADLWLVIGTTGEVMPACQLPREAKMNGATIVEINVRRSYFTPHVTDIFLQGKATEVAQALIDALYGG